MFPCLCGKRDEIAMELCRGSGTDRLPARIAREIDKLDKGFPSVLSKLPEHSICVKPVCQPIQLVKPPCVIAVPDLKGVFTTSFPADMATSLQPLSSQRKRPSLVIVSARFALRMTWNRVAVTLDVPCLAQRPNAQGHAHLASRTRRTDSLPRYPSTSTPK